MAATSRLSSAILSHQRGLILPNNASLLRPSMSRGVNFSPSAAASSSIRAVSILTTSSYTYPTHLNKLNKYVIIPSSLPISTALLNNNQRHNNIIIQHQQPQRRSLFIQTSETPNPESLKFVPNGRLVLGHNSQEDTTLENGEEVENNNNNNNDNNTNNGVYLTRKDTNLISRSPLAKLLFNLDSGIKSIYLGYDFLTVTKYAEAHWQHLQTPIFGTLMDFYASNEPVMHDTPQITDTTILDDDDEIVAMIKELLETRIRPAVQEDGGDIRYVSFEEESGIVTVQLAGSCVGCPSSSVTLKNGVENMLMHYIPEVRGVVSLEEEEEDDEDGEEEGSDGDGSSEVVVEQNSADGEEKKKYKTYQDKLAAAGIPFSD